MKIASPVVRMFPHRFGAPGFFCYCSKWHTWGEPGTRTFRLPTERHQNQGYRMILCDCGIWHMQPLTAELAENLIKAEEEE